MKTSALLLLIFACAASVRANVKLPALFSDHMVMQAESAVPIWGWAEPGEEITVSFGAQSKTTKTGADGRWKVTLDKLKASDQPQTLTVKGKNTLTVTDVLVGEVWLGSGQSNMAFKVASSNVAPKTLAEAKAQAASVRPAIRFFMTLSRGADEPQEDVVGHWTIAEPETIGTCSAVAWYFGLALHEKLHTPVGLIVSAVGGTAAEVWIPKKELDATSVAGAIWKRHQDALAGYSKEAEVKYEREEAAWRTANPTPELKIKNARSRPKPFYTPDSHHVPVRLYNGKIAGLEPYAIKGIIWFQADGNNSHPQEYSELIQTLIRTWRAHWKAELPFYYVEMNNMHPLQTKPDEDKPLAQIREAQNGALKLPRTGVVASIDLGIAENAHFPVKKPVGDRLANLALAEVYHLPLGEVHSPEFASYKLEGNKIRVSLKYADGLRSRIGEVGGFALRNADGKWVWANGKVDGTDLLLWSADLPSPQELRYAWAENPIISIENGAGLPLRPFRIELNQTPQKPGAKKPSASVAPTDLHVGKPKEITNSIGMRFVRIEPGQFLMGQDGPRADYSTMRHADKCDDADWDERPVHRVKISNAFLMAATEVTIAQYRQFNPKLKLAGEADEAVTNVKWHDAVKFCEWLSKKEGQPYRLPTEAEWEFACRAGTTTPFSTGERLPDGFQKYKINDKAIKRFFTKAGKFPSDYRDWPKGAPLRVAQTVANAWGLFDMHGNVEEWCLDWYGPYEANAATDPVGRVDGDFRVTRGGSHDVFSRFLRSANRSGRIAETSNDQIGFRVVLGEMPKTAPLPRPTPPLNARNVSQSTPKIERVTKPFFGGPKRFVKVPLNLAGPMFSDHNHSPAIAECPNGDLLSVWFSCGDEGGPELAVLASRLRHGATEWEEASPFWDGPDINDHAPKLWFDGDKTLFFFAKGLSGDAMRTSTDNGETWSKPLAFQPEAEIGNQPIRTREGAIILPLDGNKPGANFNISRDGGKTWTFTASHGKPDWRPGVTSVRYVGIHNAIEQLADGRFIAFVRVDTPEQKKPFNFRTPVGYSSDWGKTWQLEASEFPAIGSVQRAVLMRLHEGPLLFCSFTDEQRYWSKRKGMTFKAADGSEFTGYGLFAAVSFDEGKTWPVQKLITPGGPERTLPSVDKRDFVLSDTMSEAAGYLAACQTRDDLIQLISSKNHYAFNVAWLKEPPPQPKK